MPGLVELAYTTAGGIVGAALTNYFTKIQERRQLRAEVYRHLTKVGEISGGIRNIKIGAAPHPSSTDRRPSIAVELGIAAVLDDGTDAHHALRDALADLLTAVLVAGTPRRVADFAGGAHERRLDSALLTQTEHSSTLYEQLDPDGRRWDAWGLKKQGSAS